jgi:hypothetical protein
MNGDKFRKVGGGRKLITRGLTYRFNVVDRTIYRWVEAGILPRPTYINNRKYWEEDEVIEADRALRAASA